MPLLVHANEATASQRTVAFDLRDATDGITPETGEAGGQPQISTNYGAWTNTGIGTLSHVGNGLYSAVVTQAAVATAGDIIETRYKSANTAETRGDKLQVVGFDPAAALSTYGGADTAGTTTLLSRLTAPRATSLDNLDGTVSSVNTGIESLSLILGNPSGDSLAADVAEVLAAVGDVEGGATVEQIAARLLVTPANKLATNAAGAVTVASITQVAALTIQQAAAGASTGTIYQAATNVIGFSGLGDISDRDKFYLAIKAGETDVDAASLILAEETGGLLYRNRTTAGAGEAGWTVWDVTNEVTGAGTVELDAELMALFAKQSGLWIGMKKINAAGIVTPLAEGRINIERVTVGAIT